jgi:Prokaryotic E2 family E
MVRAFTFMTKSTSGQFLLEHLGPMALPPRLEHEILEIRKTSEAEVYEDSSFVNIVLKNFPLGPGFNLNNADVLIRVPLSYPDSGPDMFWTDPKVVLANGQEPQAATVKEQYLGREWRRFSWHFTGWKSMKDNLFSYVEFVRRRLAQKQ